MPTLTTSFPSLPSISLLLPRAKAQINEIGKKWRPLNYDVFRSPVRWPGPLVVRFWGHAGATTSLNIARHRPTVLTDSDLSRPRDCSATELRLVKVFCGLGLNRLHRDSILVQLVVGLARRSNRFCVRYIAAELARFVVRGVFCGGRLHTKCPFDVPEDAGVPENFRNAGHCQDLQSATSIHQNGLNVV